MKVGSGDLSFELVPDWEQLPSDWEHPDVVGVCTDTQLNVYLFCRGPQPVIVYDKSGTALGFWGEDVFPGRPHGMFLTGAEELLLVDDRGHSVGRYSLDGRMLQTIGPEGEASDTGYDGNNLATVARAAGPFNRPTDAAAGASGDIFVTDGYGNSRIHRFNSDGDLTLSWGEPGVEAGQFNLPHALWVHDDGRIFVADRENERIQIFSSDGKFLAEWTDIHQPQDVLVDRDGLVYVAELGARKGTTSPRRGPIEANEPCRLSIFDPSGELLLRWGDGDGTQAGHFAGPHAIWIDAEGSLYVAEVTESHAVKRGFVPHGTHTFQKFARV
jgi:hypothetical protein